MLSTRTNDNRRTWALTTSRVVSYEVIETSNLFDPTNTALLVGGSGKTMRRIIVIDEVVHKIWAEQIDAYFKHHKVDYRVIPVEATEKNKSFELFYQIAREFDAFRLDRRNEPVIAIGGGVLTDVVSMVASCYRRGTPCIRVPTTLMGYVDAAIGIKTAVNFDSNKNRIGTFAEPFAVILDRAFLKTLPMRHILNGVGEIAKMALIRDNDLFELLESQGRHAVTNRFQNSGEEILRRAIHGMLEELEPNLFEDNLERAVDYGHTFSPLLEMRDIDNLLHGEAVAIDCAFSVVLSQLRGLISSFTANRVLAMMHNVGLPIYHPELDAEMCWHSLEERTNHRGGLQRVPLINAIGRVQFANDITRAELERAVHVWQERCTGLNAARHESRRTSADNVFGE
ncbi:MAG: sedoheptulose 7-phosphate cyclase [Polyangiaceae bacterium]